MYPFLRFMAPQGLWVETGLVDMFPQKGGERVKIDPGDDARYISIYKSRE